MKYNDFEYVCSRMDDDCNISYLYVDVKFKYNFFEILGKIYMLMLCFYYSKGRFFKFRNVYNDKNVFWFVFIFYL